MTWYVEKTVLNPARLFLSTNENSPLKNSCLGVQCTTFLCYMCFPAQIRFCCEKKKGLKMDVGKPQAVWSGRNRCHMSQEIGIKFRVAWHPSFPNSSYNVRRFVERENPKKPPSRLLKLWSAITRELIALESQWRHHRIQKAASHFWGILRVLVTSFGRKTVFHVATIFRGFHSESCGWQTKHVGSKFST